MNNVFLISMMVLLLKVAAWLLWMGGGLWIVRCWPRLSTNMRAACFVGLVLALVVLVGVTAREPTYRPKTDQVQESRQSEYRHPSTIKEVKPPSRTNPVEESEQRFLRNQEEMEQATKDFLNIQ